MIFWWSDLCFCGPQVQVISPLLLGSSRLSTSSIGTDAYRQKAILSTSYQAVTETSEASDCKDDSFGQYSHFFAHTKIAEMIQDHNAPCSDRQRCPAELESVGKTARSDGHGRTSFGRLCTAVDDSVDEIYTKNGFCG